MAQELTFNITEDVRRLKRPTTVKDFQLSFGHADQGPTDVVIGDDGNIVQGRYGDSARQVFVNVVQGKNNEPVDITGYLPEFNGCIPDAEHIVIDNWDGVLVDPRHGRFRFDFPIQAFTVAGSYKQAYFRLVQNGTGKTLATLEFDMQVLEDFVYSNIVPQDYVTPYLDMINKLKDAYTNFVGKTQDSFDQAKKRLDDIMSTVENEADTVEQRLKIDEQALTELSKKIDEKGLFTEDEAKQFEDLINNKLADVQAETQKLKETLSGAGLMVNDYGAKADGETDDTAAIQEAIDAFAKSKSNKLVFSGTYKVSKADADSDKRAYALKLAALSNRTIDLTNAKFKTDLVDDFPNIFAFYNCKDIYVVGGYAEAVNFNLTKGHPLYYGAFIYAKGCTNLSVYRTSTFNMMYDVCIMDSQYGAISGNHFAHDLDSKNVHDFLPASAILLYNGVNYHVTGNDIIGGLRDGDLSVFGGASYGNIVSDNHLKALVYWSEGITVDGGACKTIVSNNLLSGGYNFGIDVKFNSENTLVANNTIEKCVVAISDRGGEINSKAQVFETVIKNNNIIFGGLPVDTQTLGFFGYNQIGIDVENQFTSDISGNHFTLGKGYNTNYKIVGIKLNQPNYSYDYLTPASIAGNFFEFKNGVDSSYQIAGEGSVEVLIADSYYADISNNVFKGNNDDVALVKIQGTNQTIKISDNYFMANGIEPVHCDDNTVYSHLIITNDNYCGDFTDITNAKRFQISTLRNHQSYLAQKVAFSENTTEPFLNIIPQWSSNTLIRVSGEFDYMGTFVLSGTYKIQISDGKINVHTVNADNTDVVLCATKIADNVYGLVARATRATKSDSATFKPYMNIYTEILDGEYGTSFA